MSHWKLQNPEKKGERAEKSKVKRYSVYGMYGTCASYLSRHRFAGLHASTGACVYEDLLCTWWQVVCIIRADGNWEHNTGDQSASLHACLLLCTFPVAYLFVAMLLDSGAARLVSRAYVHTQNLQRLLFLWASLSLPFPWAIKYICVADVHRCTTRGSPVVTRRAF